MSLIAEDLLLLLLDGDSGALVQQSYVKEALAGAVLADLAVADAVEMEERTVLGFGAQPHVVPAKGASVDDPLLADALAVVAQKPRTAQSLLGPLGKDLRERLTDRLVERGILRREEGRVLGLFPRTTWPTVDSAHEDEVRRTVRAVLLEGAEPDERTAALVGLLHAIDRAHKTVDARGSAARDVKKRAKAVAEGEVASAAVRRAVEAINTAVVTAVVASSSAAAASGSS